MKPQYSHDNAMILEKKSIIVKKIQYWTNFPKIQEKKVNNAMKPQYSHDNAMILEKECA